MPSLFKVKIPSESVLRQLFPARRSESEECRLSIIIVPDLPTKTPKATLKSSWSQLQEVLGCEVVKPCILGFEYTIPRDAAIWTFLLSQSEVLLKQIHSEAENLHLFARPLLFVAQGLGGLIVKQALVNVSGQYPSPPDIKVRETYQGSIFISTPHPVRTKQPDWVKLNHILKTGPKFDKERLIQAESERLIVANLSNRFEKAANNTPVLSICESKETKISTRVFDSSKYILVDKVFGATRVPYEDLLSVHLDHYEIFRTPPNAEMFSRIRSLLQAVSIRRVMTPLSGGSNRKRNESINDEIEDSIGFSGELVEEPDGLGRVSDEAVKNSMTERSSPELLTLYEFTSQENTLKVPLHLLKPAVQNPNFHGRDAILHMIDQVLLPDTTKIKPIQKCFALYGLGGVGKTQVAMEYAFSRRGLFDAVFWIDADQSTQLSEAFSAIATYLGHTESPDQDSVVSRNVVLEWLCKPRKRKSSQNQTPEDDANWLLIFNNADDLQQLQSFWPQCNFGSILITSRDPLARRGRDGIELEPFEPNEAAELLRKLLNAPNTASDIETSTRLATRLGGLPLAITQVAALIERWDMTLQEFLEYFESRVSIERVAKGISFDPHDLYKHSLFTVWALDGLSPCARALLQLISFLNPDSIRERLVRAHGVVPITDYPTNEDDFIDARTELLKVSLIKRTRPNKDGPEYDGELTLHRLVQDVSRAQTKQEDTSATVRFVLRLLLASWPTPFLQFDHDSAIWAKCGELLPHITRIRAEIKKHSVYDTSIETRGDYAKLLLFAGWYLFERLDFENAKSLYVDVLDLCQPEMSALALIRADVLFALSALSAQVNEDTDTTVSYAKEHFQLREQLRDGSDLGEMRMSMAYGELAHVQMIAGQHEDAIANAKMAIEMTWKTPLFLQGKDWPTFSHCHQALSLAETEGYESALKLVDATLDYWGKHSHETHDFVLGITYRCLALVKKKQGCLQESKAAYLIALEHFKSTVGENSHYTSQCCRNVGVYHSKEGNYETALAYLDQAVRGYRIHKFYQPELALTLFCLSQTHRANGDDVRANSFLGEAMELYKNQGGKNSSDAVTEKDFEIFVHLPSR